MNYSIAQAYAQRRLVSLVRQPADENFPRALEAASRLTPVLTEIASSCGSSVIIPRKLRLSQGVTVDHMDSIRDLREGTRLVRYG